MAIIRAQARLPYFSGVPEDVVTNTFHFEVLGPPDVAVRAGIMNSVADFYSGAAPTTTVGAFLHPNLSREVDACTVELYDLTDPVPRQPIDSLNFQLPSASGTGQVPLEVAICLSFRGLYVSGQPNARRRGRVYIGPINLNAITAGTGSAFPVPAATALNQILASADDFLSQQAFTAGAIWSVYSTLDDVAYPIQSMYVDNAFDTQRRRGNAPTARTEQAVNPI